MMSAETHTHSGDLQTLETAAAHNMRELANVTYTHPTQWVPGFVHSLEILKERVLMKRKFFEDVMIEDLHYGKIPGADKPVLYKPGAELLLSSMGLNPILTDAEKPIRHYGPSEHGDEPIIAYRRICQVYRQTGPLPDQRVLVAQAEGFCTSRETKYRYRDSKRTCPECNQGAVFVSKFDKGGFYCNKKAGGCGLNYDKNDERITKQTVGRSLNAEVADLENTILKIGDKRAYVAATLLATGCSDIFTQDLEDFDFGENADGKTSPKPQEQKAKGMRPKARRSFLQAICEIDLPDAVVLAIVETVTNKKAKSVNDELITRDQGQKIVNELRSIKQQRREADDAHRRAEAGDVPKATASKEQPKKATPVRRATASASASASAGNAAGLDSVRSEIRAIAGERKIGSDQLVEMAKTASRGYAASIDDPKFNIRDAHALLSQLKGGGGGKYGAPAFANAS